MPRRIPPCDKLFPGIGRIARVTGATTVGEHRRRIGILEELYQGGDAGWRALEAVRDGTFTIREVCAAYRAKRLDRLWADLQLRRDLRLTVAAWLPAAARAAATRTRYGVSWGTLERTGVLRPGATIHDLERVDWKALQTTWPGGRHDWRHLRGFVSRFLSAQLGVEHPFRKMVVGAIPTAGQIPGRVPDLTPEAFWRIVAALPEHVRPAPVAILATGMRIGEFCRAQETDLKQLTMAVHVPGTKTDFAEDVIPVDPALWPWIERAIPCPVGHWRLRELWRRACRKAHVEDVTLHDLRHCLGQWLVAAGEPESAVQGMLRHASAEMTRRYTRHDGRAKNARAIGAILLAVPRFTHGDEGRAGRSA